MPKSFKDPQRPPKTPKDFIRRNDLPKALGTLIFQIYHAKMVPKMFFLI